MTKWRNPFFPHPPQGNMPVIDPQRITSPNGRQIVWGFQGSLARDGAVFTEGRSKLVSWQSPDALPQPVTLQLFVERPTPGGGNQFCEFNADIEWQVDAAPFSANVDMCDGVSLGLIANAITVNTNGGILTPANSVVNLFASISLGAKTVSGNIKPQKTVARTVTAATSPILFAIPRWARTIDVLRSPDTADLTLALNGGLLLSSQAVVSVAAGAQFPREIPIPATAYQVSLATTSVGPVNVSVVFGLNL